MHILFVCHANICRSPMAERLAAYLSGGRLGVASAGTHAAAGDPMHPGAVAALREVGADPDRHASRPLSAELVERSALVLTATREQRAACVTLVPAALSRVFTLRQFGRLSVAAAAESTVEYHTESTVDGDDPAQRLAALRTAVIRIRGTVQPVPAADDDLVDPVNGTLDDVRACLRNIRAALVPWISRVDSAVMGGPRFAAGGWPTGPAGPA